MNEKDRYAEFIRFLACQFVTQPSQLTVELAPNFKFAYGIRCAKADEALIIGRAGGNIQALREIAMRYVELDGTRSFSVRVLCDMSVPRTEANLESRRNSNWTPEDAAKLRRLVNDVHLHLVPFERGWEVTSEEYGNVNRTKITLHTEHELELPLMTAYDHYFRTVGKFMGRTINFFNEAAQGPKL